MGLIDRSLTWLQRKQLFPFCQEEGIRQPEAGKQDQRLKSWRLLLQTFLYGCYETGKPFAPSLNKRRYSDGEIVCEKAHVFHVMISILFFPSFNCYFSWHKFCLVLCVFQ